jgi:hypothetical protein
MMFMKKPTLFFALFVLFVQVQAQVNTISSGNWDDPSIWSTGSVPTSTAGVITINHSVTIPAGFSVTVDEVVSNALITIATSGVLTVANGTGTDLTINGGNSMVVNGEFILSNLATISQVGATIGFGPGATYRHRYTATEGIPPVATWDPASNFVIEGYSNVATLNLTAPEWSQSYGNFTYNCPLQRAAVNFNGLITDINGDFLIASTGNNFTQLTVGQNNIAVNVDGNFTIAGTSRFNLSTLGTGSSLNVNGDFSYNSTNINGSMLTNIGSFTVNVMGDFLMNAGGGRLFMAGSSGSTGTSTLNINQNFTLTSGQITESGSGNASGTIQFLGAGEFDFVNTGSIINRIHYYISPATILDLSVYPISGAGSAFVLDGTIIVGSLEPTGAIRNSTTLGNIRTTTSSRVYSPGSTVIYRASAAQIMGDGQPSGTGVTTIIDNSQGVSLFQGTAAQATISGDLQLESGTLFIGNRRLNLNGTISYGTGALGGDANSILVISGTTGGDFGTLSFDPSSNILGVLTFNRTGAASSISVNAPLTLTSQLNLISGTFNNTSGLALDNDATLSQWPTSQLLGSRISHEVGESYNVIYRTASTSGNPATYTTGLELPDPTDDTGLKNLTISTAQTTDIVQLAQDVSVNGNFTLTRGTFQGITYDITMRGTSWIDNSGNFAPGTGTVTFDGITTISGTSTAILGSIAMTSTASLTTTVNTNISGDITFQAGSTFTSGTVTTTLNGSTTQTLSPAGGTFFNITVSKSGGNVLLTSAMNLIGFLNFTSPSTNINFQSNGFLTLRSTSDAPGTTLSPGTSQIYRLTSGNTVTGNVTAERFMSGEGRIYRYLTSPVSNASVASWQDDFPITGTFSNPSSGSPSCGFSFVKTDPSLYYYDETVAGGVDAGYIAYPTVGNSAANPLDVGRGYAAFIRRCNSPTVVDVTGPINQGTITFNITYTNTGDATADGYNLIGNPYPCTVDWDAGWVKTRISPIISIRDNGAGGIMRYWDGTAGDIPNGQIAPGQAFWVRATAASPILRITETSKVIVPNAAGEFFRSAPVSSLPILLSDGLITDKAFVKIRPESVNTLDDWDAPKLDNEVFDLYTVSEDKVAMAINARSDIHEGLIIPLGIRDLEKGEYTLSLGEMVGEFNQFSYILFDTYTNDAVSFREPYRFVVNEELLSSREDRFRIQIRSSESQGEIARIVYPNPVERYLYIKDEAIDHTQITVLDNLGKVKTIKSQRIDGSMVLDFEGIPSGIYFLNMFVDQTVSTLKIIKK